MSGDRTRRRSPSPSASHPSSAPTEGPAGWSAAERQAAHVAALLGLPGMGPRRLDRLLAIAPPEQVWARLRAGATASDLARVELAGDRQRLLAAWSTAARTIDPAGLWQAHARAGVRVVARGGEGYPGRFTDDPEPPALLFIRGEPELLEQPSVALVGTRRATSYGLRLARAWGSTLSAAGVAVVSGLAAGIDAAAHDGALAAGGAAPVAVVGTGLDVVYPSSSRSLWQRVGTCGAVVSEAPLGTRAEPWRFPARNRIIAALADVVVVVESHERGGSLLTADEATARHRSVLAVPGSVHSPASRGTHRLIADGAGLAASVDDVLVALGSRRPRAVRPATPGGVPAGPGAVDEGPIPDARERALLAALGWEPATLDDLVGRTGWSLAVTCAVLEPLLRRDVVRQQGPWLTQEGDSGGV